MAITAPFQFARIPRAVWFPEWSHLVSHDVPFADGYSGTIDIEIEAMTPLLIGGQRREAAKDKAGEVWPVKLPDGPYAIPGSSLQGMIRNILEIACFGKLGPWVGQRRFGVRDISPNETGKTIYASRMTGKTSGIIVPKTRAGWLQRSQTGNVEITSCDFARINARNIEALAGGTAAPNLRAKLTAATNAKERYDAFLNTPRGATPNKAGLQVHVTLQSPTSAAHSCGPIWYTHCTAMGPQAGQLVFTGKPVAGDQANRKHFEFVFYGNPGATIVNADHVWHDFRLIHKPPKGSGQKTNPNWDYWKDDFEAGKPVPIFYIEEVDENGVPKPGSVAAMGTAFMFKLAHTNDTHQMLDNSSDSHLDKEKYDLPSLIFGGVGDDSENAWLSHSLKRRASFEWAKSSGDITPITPQYERLAGGQFKNGFAPAEQPDATLLLGPKPSYYPIYVRQPNPVDGLYASYTPVKRRPSDAANSDALARWVPELSGAKLWPSPVDFKADEEWQLPAPAANYGNQTRGQTDSKETHVSLNALPPGTKFSTKLHFHNLRKVELGALLWALTFGDTDALAGGIPKKRHRVGMGKPYGMGSIKIALGTAELLTNNKSETSDIAKIVNHFVKQMNDLLPVLANERQFQWISDVAKTSASFLWKETVQIKALIEAAEQDANHDTPYMPLNGENGYTTQRNGNDALSPFVPSGWELKRRQSKYDIPINEKQTSVGNGNHKNIDRHRGQKQDQPHHSRAAPPPPPEYNGPELAAVKGATARIGSREGKIVYIGNGKARIRLADGSEQSLTIGKNLFTVIAHPANSM